MVHDLTAVGVDITTLLIKLFSVLCEKSTVTINYYNLRDTREHGFSLKTPKKIIQRYFHGELSMPIYEYKCSACGHIFEILTTSGTKEDVVQCRNCQSNQVNKIISAGSIRCGSGTRLPAAAPSGCGHKSGFS